MNTLLTTLGRHIRTPKVWMTLTLLIAAAALPSLAHAAATGTDLFAAGKADIKAVTDSSSTLHFALLVVGLGVSALTGFITKNWPAAVGVFVVGLIFFNVAGSVIGLN